MSIKKLVYLSTCCVVYSSKHTLIKLLKLCVCVLVEYGRYIEMSRKYEAKWYDAHVSWKDRRSILIKGICFRSEIIIIIV